MSINTTNNKAKTKPFPGWPQYNEKELCLIQEVLESSEWCRLTGKKVKEFEQKFAQYHNVKYGIGVTNGTHALELALAAIGINPGDEVIVPAMTFIATATAVIQNNAIPVLVDIDPDTYCILPEAIEKAITNKTKAIIPVHIAGHSCDMDKICEIAKKYNLKVIEDAAHAQGGKYKNRMLGSIGDAATFSFQTKKIMTCGEGGAFITNNREYYKEALLIHSVGRPEGDRIYEHTVLGSNYRMSAFQAALLLGQFDTLNEMNLKREKNAAILDKLLSDIKGIKPQKKEDYSTLNTHYMYMFLYNPEFFNGLSRNDFVEYLNAEGIPSYICYPVISNATFYKKGNFRQKISIDQLKIDNPLNNAEYVSSNVVWLPHNLLLGDNQDMEEIRKAILKIQKMK